LKSVLSQAVIVGYIDKNPYSKEGSKVKSNPGQRKFLSIDEVNQLINADIPENKTPLYRIRDLFIQLLYRPALL